MDIILYKFSDSLNTVNKKLTNSLTINNVRFKDDSLDVLNPLIIVNGYQEITDIVQYNYCYIPKFTRYYYCTISADGSLIKINCKIDSLMSWKKSIHNSSGYIVRSEKYRNRYIVDSLLPIHSQTSYEIKNITPQDGQPVFDKNCTFVIMETTGKGGSPS